MKFGIDFGTTNSAIAYYDGEKLHSVVVDDTNKNKKILPSLIHFDREYNTAIGANAAITYMESEAGRPVYWKPKLIGEVHITVAGKGGSPIQYWQPVNIMIDQAAVGRLFQSVKTYLRSPEFEGTYIFDKYHTVDQIMSLMLNKLKTSAEESTGEICEDVVIGRPVHFSYDSAIDIRAEEVLYKAAHLAGFRNIQFATEPLGATYLYHISEPVRSKILVFDFGGGTLDLTVAEVGDNMKPQVLATQGVLVGGDDVDKVIMRMLYKYFAADEKRGGLTISYDMAALLETWHTMPELSKPHFRDQISGLQRRARTTKDVAAQSELKALEILVNNALGYNLFRDIEDVKKKLSNLIMAPLRFNHEDIQINETIQRQLLENRMRKDVKQIKKAVIDVIEMANLVTTDIDVVVRTGGTSQVPMFINLLSDIFGEEKLREIDALESVVGGLAIIAHHNVGRKPSYSDKYFSDPTELITNISCESSNNYEPYIVQAGTQCYVDSERTRIEKLPLDLSAFSGIRTSQSDVANSETAFLSFDLTVPADVYVAYSKNASSKPLWLSEFKATSYIVEIRDSLDRITLLTLYRKRYEAGSVVLGGNKAQGAGDNIYCTYLVVIEPVVGETT